MWRPEDDAECLESSIITPCFLLLRMGFSLFLSELLVWARLASRPGPSRSACLYTEMHSHAHIYMWVVGILNQVPMLAQ